MRRNFLAFGALFSELAASSLELWGMKEALCCRYSAAYDEMMTDEDFGNGLTTEEFRVPLPWYWVGIA